MNDAQAMTLALAQARQAALAGEVPVGAVILRRGQLIAAAHNAPVSQKNPTAHAEVLALCEAASAIGNYRLDDCELFVTLEPCSMCAGAILHARLKRVVFGAYDPKTGAAGSVVNLFDNALLNHQTRVQGGLMEVECSLLLRDFFQQKRATQFNRWPLREDALRTPEVCFEQISALPYTSHYLNDLPSLAGLRFHYMQAGQLGQQTTTTICLHGPGEWSQAWHEKMAQIETQGQCVFVPDLIGFGRSDKPKKQGLHRLNWHAQVLFEWILRLELPCLTVLVSPENILLAEVFQSKLPQQITQVISFKPSKLTPEEMNAPYPDSGHRAAWRAFSQADWLHTCASATISAS